MEQADTGTWPAGNRHALNKHKHHVTLRDGQSLFVRSIGRGRPVMLLHGFGMNSNYWLPFALPRARHYRFLLPDLRGSGRSHHIHFNREDVLDNHADDVLDILDSFGIDQVALGGVSMGAYTALRLNQRGDFGAVSKYLNIDQCARARNGDEWQNGLFGEHQAQEFARFNFLLDEAETYRHVAYWRLPPPLRRKLAGHLTNFICYAFNRRHQHVVIRQSAKYFERLLTRGFMPVHNWPAYLDVMRAYMQQDYDMRDSLSRISVPTTLMTGMRSAMYPARGQLQMREQIPHARVVTFKRSGHLPLIDEPVKFHRELGRFLAA